MQTKTKEFLKYLGLDETEIEDMLHACPGIKIAEPDNIIKCTYALIENDIPIYEIENIIKKNPLILLDSPGNLTKKIKLLGDDFALKIKQNPNLI